MKLFTNLGTIFGFILGTKLVATREPTTGHVLDPIGSGFQGSDGCENGNEMRVQKTLLELEREVFRLH